MGKLHASIPLDNHEVEMFPILAKWCGYDSVDKWLTSLLETSLDHEFDVFYDNHPDFERA